MATMPTNVATNPDTLVTIKVVIDGGHRRFKVPLRELGANVLPGKLRFLLDIPESQEVRFERYSDSAAAFVVLDPNDLAIFKQLYRAAKAKLKLRIKATVIPSPADGESAVDTKVESTGHPNQMGAPIEEVKSAVTDENTPPANHDLIDTSPTPAAKAHAYPAATVTDEQPQLEEAADEKTSTASLASANKVADTDAEADRPSMSTTEAPVLDLATVRQSLLSVAQSAQARYMAHMSGRASVASDLAPPPPASYMVYCNACDRPIRRDYYHCSTCDGGDFDLCCDCVQAGHLCRCDGHWMIKRTIKDGRIINSTTETARPRSGGAAATAAAPRSAAPSTATVTTAVEGPVVDDDDDDPVTMRDVMRRTVKCRGCFKEASNRRRMVLCTTCEDYCLCVDCLVDMKHGHDPKHAFTADATAGVVLNPVAQALCAPGRNMRHFALCDGCDKTIIGIRHKCLDCPDWDYCSTCIPNAVFIHPGHRFVQVVEPLSSTVKPGPLHFAKLCDGPLCKGKPVQTYIRGDRYKCAVCHDTDFCANCEASPLNQHNKTHPLIKFKTPVRNVTVCTIGERADGGEMPVMGDLHARNPWAETAPAASTSAAATANAATQVQTVVDVKPVQPVAPEPEVRDMAASAGAPEPEPELGAHFVRDTIPDGTVLPPNHVFRQTWTIRNPGPADWPKGCSVKFVGGDNMRNIDPAHPISVAELEKSVESDVLPLDVGTGVNWCFTVTLKTPKRSGRYISYWRLTAPNGVKFGHKLWCEIEVSPDAHKTVTPGLSPAVGSHQEEMLELVADSTEPKSQGESSKPKGDESDVAEKKPGRIDNLLLLQRELHGSVMRAREQQAVAQSGTDVDSSLPLRSRYAPGRQVETTRDESPERPQVEHVEDVAEEKEDAGKGKGKMEESEMIFPKLDKESPVVSEGGAHEGDKAEDDGTSAQEEQASEVEIETEEHIISDDESEDGFLTDEEYDILDASDEEFLAVAQKQARK